MEAIAKSRWRSKAFWIIAALCLVSSIPLALWAYAWRGDRELAEAIAEADRSDPGWRLEELEAHRAQVPDSANAALVVEQVVSLIPAGWPTGALLNDPEERKRAREFGTPFDMAMDDLRQLKGPGPLSDFHRRHLRLQLLQVRQALDEARKLVDMPSGRFAGGASSLGSNASAVQWGDRTKARDLLLFDAIDRADQGQIDLAFVSVRALLNAMRSGGDEPEFLATLSRQAGPGASSLLEFSLADGVASAGALAELQAILEEQDRIPVLLNCARVVRAELHNRLSRVESGELDIGWAGIPNSGWAQPLRPVIVPSAHAWALRFFAKCIAIGKLPSPDRKPPWDALMATIDSAPIPARMVMLSTLIRDKLEPTQERQTVLRCMIVGLAAERFRVQHGRWPSHVSELDGPLRADSTLDPVTGKPIEIRKWSEGLLICGHYSQSKDLKLPVDAREGVRFRLWDVALRGRKASGSAAASVR
jgi:hypothetical protein